MSRVTVNFKNKTNKQTKTPEQHHTDTTATCLGFYLKKASSKSSECECQAILTFNLNKNHCLIAI